MAFNYSPKLVTNGLVFAIDAANAKSYISGSSSMLDISPTGNIGTLINGPIFNSGFGGSIVFDGTNDFVGFGDVYDEVIAGTNKQFTISCAIYPTSTSGNQVVIGKYSDSGTSENGREFGIMVRDLGTGYKIDVLFGADLNNYINIVRSDNTISINNPWIITVTYDDTQATSLAKVNIYINGVLSGKTHANVGTFGPIASGPAQFALGASVSSAGATVYRYPGRIYSALLYNRLLSSTEIQQNYNTIKTRFGL
jgi:hypothetical protein